MNRKVVCGLLVIAPAISSGQGAPVSRLGAPEVEFTAELSAIAGVRELADRRVILVDRKERTVLLLDPQTRAATRIGREGAGPGEYQRPGGLVQLPGDTTLIEDRGNNRYLILGDGGRLLGTMPLVSYRPSEGVTYGLSPRGVDATGRFYFALPTGLVSGERIPILRYDRRSQRFDTVASIRNDRFGAQRGAPAASSGGATFGMNASTPFAARDDWAVAPDGAIGVAHPAPYSIEWYSANRVLATGPSIPFTPVKVTDAEKNQWREQQRETGGGTLTTRDASGRTTTQAIPVPEPATWPDTKPPFVSAGVLAAPDGSLWILRSGAATDKSATYDVVGRNGTVARKIEMDANLRVIGFGNGTVYVVRRDDDGLQYLRRYRMPR